MQKNGKLADRQGSAMTTDRKIGRLVYGSVKKQVDRTIADSPKWRINRKTDRQTDAKTDNRQTEMFGEKS